MLIDQFLGLLLNLLLQRHLKLLQFILSDDKENHTGNTDYREQKNLCAHQDKVGSEYRFLPALYLLADSVVFLLKYLLPGIVQYLQTYRIFRKLRLMKLNRLYLVPAVDWRIVLQLLHIEPYLDVRKTVIAHGSID